MPGSCQTLEMGTKSNIRPGTSSFMCLQVTLKISGQGWKDPQALDAPIPHPLHPHPLHPHPQGLKANAYHSLLAVYSCCHVLFLIASLSY